MYADSWYGNTHKMADPSSGSHSVPVDLSGSFGGAIGSQPVRRMGKLKVANRAVAQSLAEARTNSMDEYDVSKTGAERGEF